MFSTLLTRLPSPPEFVTLFIRWGDPAHIRWLFASTRCDAELRTPGPRGRVPLSRRVRGVRVQTSGGFIRSHRALEELGRWQETFTAFEPAVDATNQSDDATAPTAPPGSSCSYVRRRRCEASTCAIADRSVPLSRSRIAEQSRFRALRRPLSTARNHCGVRERVLRTLPGHGLTYGPSSRPPLGNSLYPSVVGRSMGPLYSRAFLPPGASTGARNRHLALPRRRSLPS